MAIFELEQRIYFDAALPVDVAEMGGDAGDADTPDAADASVTDTQAEAQSDPLAFLLDDTPSQAEADSSDTPSTVNQDSTDNSMAQESGADGNDSSDTVAVDDTLTDFDPNSAESVKVLLISSLVEDADVLADAAQDDVMVIKYDAEALSLESLLEDIQAQLNGKQVSSMALASHDAGAGRFSLTESVDTEITSLIGDQAQQAFWQGLGNLIEDGGRIDILACGLTSEGEGLVLVQKLESLTGHDIAASNDLTGNTTSGGDWYLETGNINAEDIYFDSALLNTYTGTLAALVQDILPGASSSDPKNFAVLNGITYFAADNGTSGVELWRTDGTDAGTYMVKDINPGIASGAPNQFTVQGSALIFAATDSNGTELWRTDGTDAGTYMLADIYASAPGSSPNALWNANGTVFFAADDGINGRELWKTDGTAAGTVLVSNINGTAADSISSSASFNHLASGELVFAADDGASGVELWKSDGTAGGTVMIQDIEASTGSSNPQAFFMNNNIMYFKASQVTTGYELWSTDGTNATLVKDIYSTYFDGLGTNGVNPFFMGGPGNDLYFVATDGSTGLELWRSDGTDVGTTLVKDIYPGVQGSNISDIQYIGGKLFFSAYNLTYGQELWVSDGTSAGTNVIDINSGGSSNATNIADNGSGQAVFSANDGSTGVEPWQSDGTVAGTTLLADLNPGTANSSPSFFTANGGTFLFAADDGTHGSELWTSGSGSSSSTGTTTTTPVSVINDSTDTGTSGGGGTTSTTGTDPLATDTTTDPLAPATDPAVDTFITGDVAPPTDTNDLVVTEIIGTNTLSNTTPTTSFGLPNGETGIAPLPTSDGPALTDGGGEYAISTFDTFTDPLGTSSPLLSDSSSGLPIVDTSDPALPTGDQPGTTDSTVLDAIDSSLLEGLDSFTSTLAPATSSTGTDDSGTPGTGLPAPGISPAVPAFGGTGIAGSTLGSFGDMIDTLFLSQQPTSVDGLFTPTTPGPGTPPADFLQQWQTDFDQQMDLFFDSLLSPSTQGTGQGDQPSNPLIPVPSTDEEDDPLDFHDNPLRNQATENGVDDPVNVPRGTGLRP